MMSKRVLVVLDFDGLLVNSYALLRDTMAGFGLDVGDEQRFRNRRKFLKYLGGGKELLNNLVGMGLPKTGRLRERLTACYCERGYVYPEFIDVLNRMIRSRHVHCGIVSRNFTLRPGTTIRTVLRRSGIAEEHLDFVVPIPVGAKKTEVLAGMWAARYQAALLLADEVGDYHAAREAGYESMMGTYGFDTRERLMRRGEVPSHALYDTPAELAAALRARLVGYGCEETDRLPLLPGLLPAALPALAAMGAR
ncbi:MAG: hypothetical protein K2Y51_19425 [Gammaproteobacteria bacterium]|jgi:phosphoglycolate phosphatase-like HAD superfamily hydrolase|nr:hypothetical protein [Gammaproteobacteria bacterium]